MNKQEAIERIKNIETLNIKDIELLREEEVENDTD